MLGENEILDTYWVVQAKNLRLPRGEWETVSIRLGREGAFNELDRVNLVNKEAGRKSHVYRVARVVSLLIPEE